MDESWDIAIESRDIMVVIKIKYIVIKGESKVLGVLGTTIFQYL